MPHVLAVIMAGGSGTRFWPASRAATPKQLLPLAGNPDETLLAATVRRLEPLIAPGDVYVATGAHLAEATSRALPCVPRSQILCEPVPRNTAPCIAWANAVIARSDPDAIVVVLPADHHIAHEEAFRDVAARAIDAAGMGYMATIGVVPTRPEVGYGYIEVAKEVAPGIKEVARFVEKPDLARAEAYLAGGKHLWNAGMFFFRASAMKAEVAKHLPELARGMDALDDAAKRGDEARALAEVFPEMPSISIDHGVMEKAARLAVVPGDFGWNDVGSWQSAWELAPKDGAENALPEGSIAVDARGNLVRDLSSTRGKKRYALVGVEGLVLVQTDDAVLVIPRERAQDVRAVVDALKARGEKERL
jgi:mannose-1-phosphate guanylyltransferase